MCDGWESLEMKREQEPYENCREASRTENDVQMFPMQFNETKEKLSSCSSTLNLLKNSFADSIQKALCE